MPIYREFNLQERSDRLRGLAQFAQDIARDDALAIEIREAEKTCTADLELALVKRLFTSLRAKNTLEGIAWNAWMDARIEIWKLADAKQYDGPASYYSTGEADVLLRNIITTLTASEREPDSSLTIHAMLSALSQVEALLTDCVRAQVFAGLKEKHPKADARLIEFLSLSWAPDLRFSLSEIRNAWAHGRALLSGNALVLHQRKTFAEQGRIELIDLQRLIRVGQATWTAFQIDLVFLAASEEAQSGTRINTQPLDPQRRHRRLPEATRAEKAAGAADAREDP